MVDIKRLVMKVLEPIISATIEDSLYYIAGSDVLPPPLEPSEEENYLKRMRCGEDVRPVLIERNLRLVVYIAKKFENTGVGIEDLISIGTIGLIKAINTFDTNKNIMRST